MSFLHVCISFALCSLIVLLFSLTLYFWRKSQITSSFSLRSATDEGEDMTFSFNGLEDEDFDSKLEKIEEGFKLIQERKNEKHRQWLETKAKAIAENEKRDPKDLKMNHLADAAVLEANARAVN